MSHYCDIAPDHYLHGPYHDKEYGFPVLEDSVLFERLILEINQAGLSWLTILKKRKTINEAYNKFNIDEVASYEEVDMKRLLSDPGVIRNRLKISAAIYNAKQIKIIQNKHNSFLNWLYIHHPKTKNEWVNIFKDTFHFTGGEITNEFLMSIGFLPGAHQKNCPIFDVIYKLNPAWKYI